MSHEIKAEVCLIVSLFASTFNAGGGGSSEMQNRVTLLEQRSQITKGNSWLCPFSLAEWRSHERKRSQKIKRLLPPRFLRRYKIGVRAKAQLAEKLTTPSQIINLQKKM